MKRNFLVYLFFVSLISITPSLADTIVADRPGFSTGTYTVKPGHLNVELGYQASFSNRGTNRTTHTVPLLDVRIGVTSESEIDILWDGWNIDRIDGDSDSSTGDISVGGKYRLVSGEQYNITAYSLVSFPIGSGSSTSDNIDPLAALLWDYAISNTITVFGVLQATSFVEDDNRRYNFQPAIGLSFSHTDRLGTFVEFFSDVSIDTGAASNDMVDAGVTYLLTDNVQIDFNFGLSLDNRSDDFLGPGLAVRF